ncbi:MAG: hypothetical protein ACK5MA_08475 [Parachlamydiaceae bacterium]
MPIDYSARDYQLNDVSVIDAIQSTYSYITPKEVKALKVKQILSAIHQLVQSRINNEEKFFTTHKSKESLDAVMDRVKIFLFKKRKKFTFYFYPRGLVSKPGTPLEVRCEIAVIKIDIYAEDPDHATFRVASRTSISVEKDSGNYWYVKRNFRRGYHTHLYAFENPSLTKLFHAITIEGKRKVKFCTFEERFAESLTFYKSLSLKSHKMFEAMMEALYSLHKENIFHGRIAHESIQVKHIKVGYQVAFSHLEYSAKLESPAARVECKGKPPLLSGYECIREMIKQNVSRVSYEGLPSDVWALGAALYSYLFGNPPSFALYASFAPQLNATCHKLDAQSIALNEGNDLSNTSETLSLSLVSSESKEQLAEEALPSPPALSSQLLEEFKRDMVSAGIRRPQPIEALSLLSKIEWLHSLLKKARELLNKIDPNELGNFSRNTSIEQVKEVGEYVLKFSGGVQKHLLNPTAFEELKREDTTSDLFADYFQFCDAALEFNHNYLARMRLAEVSLKRKSEGTNLLMELIKKMLHPDENKRITMKEALKTYKKNNK